MRSLEQDFVTAIRIGFSISSAADVLDIPLITAKRLAMKLKKQLRLRRGRKCIHV
jgi:DNA-directed RNA polymerase specialized sigma24 family protein